MNDMMVMAVKAGKPSLSAARCRSNTIVTVASVRWHGSVGSGSQEAYGHLVQLF